MGPIRRLCIDGLAKEGRKVLITSIHCRLEPNHHWHRDEEGHSKQPRQSRKTFFSWAYPKSTNQASLFNIFIDNMPVLHSSYGYIVQLFASLGILLNPVQLFVTFPFSLSSSAITAAAVGLADIALYMSSLISDTL